MDVILTEHRQGWASTSDEVWGQPGICLGCGHAWPCDTAIALAEVDRLSTLVAALLAVPAAHRDEYMDSLGTINWLNIYAPGTSKRAKLDGVRDTCDALSHKLAAVAAETGASSCPTCGSRSRLIRRVPQPKESDYRNGAFNDPDYDPKFSAPCTDPWHEET